jgi:2-succinyl-6-hydroxy-2,4-cyclohexadiene-1-carboxylate synthase
MPKVRINNLVYFFQCMGKGPPLIMLHGFTGSLRSWNSLTGELSSQNKSLAIDLPGHGRTESSINPKQYTMDQTAKDIISIADDLSLGQFSLLGYSMGGRLALYLAVHFPDRIKALILESASPGIADKAERIKRREWDYDLAGRIESEGILSFVNWWEQLPLFASQSAVPEQRRASLRQERLQNNAQGLANSLRGMGTGSQPSLWGALPKLTIPTLLFCGGRDEKYVQINSDMARIMLHAELVIFQDAGHNIHFEQPEAFTTVLSNFLLGMDTE